MALEMEVVNACYRMLHDTFDVKPGEVVGITYDTESDARLAMATAEAAVLLEAQPLLMQNAKLEATGGLTNVAVKDVPLDALRGALQHCDVWVYYNTKSIMGLVDELAVTNPDFRWIGLPGSDCSQIVRMIGNVDIPMLSQFMRAVTKETQNAKVIRQTTPAGTDITFSNKPGRIIGCHDGILREPGSRGWLCGQIIWCPDFESTNGVVVVDGFLHPGCTVLDQPVKFTIEKGYITNVDGGSAAKEWKQWAESVGNPNIYHISHATYGVHPKARMGSKLDICENERIWGTILWGFGNVYQSDAPDLPESIRNADGHFDGVCLNATVYIDDKLFFKDGVVVGPTDEIVELAHKLGK